MMTETANLRFENRSSSCNWQSAIGNRQLCGFLVLVAALAMVPAGWGQTDASRLTQAIQTYERATRMRVELEARPEKARSPSRYRALIATYQDVYATCPAYRNAAPALAAVAELHREMGHVLARPQEFTAAIKAYQFLIAEYPFSVLARQASLAIAEIYSSDLNQPQQARQAYQQLLEQHPQSTEAAEARKLMAELVQVAPPGRQGRSTHTGQSVQAGQLSQTSQTGQTDQTGRRDQRGPSGPVASSHLASRPSAISTPPALSATRSDDSVSGIGGANSNAPHQLAEVEAIRCWEGPGYTRVVIGVENEVKFDASRLANPDRLVFDLVDTRLNPALAGKTFPAQPFLRQVRIAQFKPNVTRAVLDVAKLDDYSVFTLPNPFRVVIDIHGGTDEVKREKQIAAGPKPVQPPSGRTTASVTPAKPPATTSPLPQERSLGSHASAENIPPQPSRSAARSPAIEGPPLVGTTGAENNSDAQANQPKQTIAAAPATRSDSRVTSDAQGNPQKRTFAVTPAGRPENGVISEEDLPAPHRPPAEAASPESIRPAGDNTIGGSESSEAVTPEKTAGAPAAADATTLTRALGLKIGRIVIDPGHGGHDTGTIGPHGLREKDLVLDVGLRLRKLLQEKAGAEVIMTRSDDTFIPLEERTAIANQKDADLFVSIHANASRDPSARGVETYYLNFTSDPHALEVAARENATSEESVHQLQDLVKKIVLTEKIKESQVFAGDVQHAVYRRVTSGATGQGNRGVKRAPFVVLIGANMPSILAEISFLTNPNDERQLRKPEYRQKIAEALYQGIYQYVSAFGGVKLAEKSSTTRPAQPVRRSGRLEGTGSTER